MKILSIRIMLGVIFVIFIVIFFHFNSKIQIKDAKTSFLEKEKVNVALPVHLKIPSLNINASVEYVGLTPDGAMDVPKGPDEVAWFNLGPRPGELGSAVIDGHSGWKNNRKAVFDNLHKLNKGDKIFIENEKGQTFTFVVRESKKYNPKANAEDIFVSSDGKAHLNLITCDGIWDEKEKSRSERLIVFADKEIEQ